MAEPVVKARRQPPVKRPAPRPPRLSQTMLALGDKCMHAAYLSLLYDGGALSHEMARGSLYHAFQERAMWTLIEHGQPNLYAGVEAELIAEFEAQHNRHPNVRELDAITAAARPTGGVLHSAVLNGSCWCGAPGVAVLARRWSCGTGRVALCERHYEVWRADA